MNKQETLNTDVTKDRTARTAPQVVVNGG